MNLFSKFIDKFELPIMILLFLIILGVNIDLVFNKGNFFGLTITSKFTFPVLSFFFLIMINLKIINEQIMLQKLRSP